jgi:hypothetical protein
VFNITIKIRKYLQLRKKTKHLLFHLKIFQYLFLNFYISHCLMTSFNMIKYIQLLIINGHLRRGKYEQNDSLLNSYIRDKSVRERFKKKTIV